LLTKNHSYLLALSLSVSGSPVSWGREVGTPRLLVSDLGPLSLSPYILLRPLAVTQNLHYSVIRGVKPIWWTIWNYIWSDKGRKLRYIIMTMSFGPINMLFSICQSMGRHFKHSVDTWIHHPARDLPLCSPEMDSSALPPLSDPPLPAWSAGDVRSVLPSVAALLPTSSSLPGADAVVSDIWLSS